MGLDICVGVLAAFADDGDAEGLAAWEETFRLLNDVLEEAGLPIHVEPRSIPPELRFEAQMWGYGGLHYVRRLAAYLALQGRLPEPVSEENNPEDDPVLERLFKGHMDNLSSDKDRGLFKWFRTASKAPPFEHLLVHSDCEGFYLPRTLSAVVFDQAQPQRDGLGAMIGSSVQLLEECRTLAKFIELPFELDPEADELWAAAETPQSDGALWQRYGIEAFTLARLLKACERSIATGAAVAFM